MSDEYAFPGLPLAPVRAGRTLLVEGATVDGVGAFVHRATDPGDGEGAILVGTNATGRRLLGNRRDAGCEADEQVYVVDCVSQQQGAAIEEPTVEGVSNPADLTGIGIRISEFYRRLAAADVDRVRIGLLSVSTLLMYADLRRVSRFVHVLAGRVASTEGVGVLALDSTAHEEQTVGTIRQLCDGRVEVRAGDEGREVRIRGLRDQPEGWLPMD